MGLFGFGKKKETKACGCGYGCDCQSVDKESAIKVFGGGCAKCNQLEEATREALESLGMSDKIQHVKDFAEIAKFGVMSTPALVVDGKVVSYGKVLKTAEVVEILKKARG